MVRVGRELGVEGPKRESEVVEVTGGAGLDGVARHEPDMTSLRESRTGNVR